MIGVLGSGSRSVEIIDTATDVARRNYVGVNKYNNNRAYNNRRASAGQL